MASSSTPMKILTVGPTVGAIRELFLKLKAIDAKHGKFDFVLCTGDFFGPLNVDGEGEGEDDEVRQLLEGKIEAPLECYIMQGQYPLPELVIDKFAKTGGEMCKRVFLLNKSGIITTAHGLRIACLGGVYDSDIYLSAEAAPGFTSPFFSSQTVERLLLNTLTKSKAIQGSYTSLAAIRSAAAPSQLIDILISNVWSSSITHFSSAPLPAPELASFGVPPLDDIIRRTKPRYHLSAGGGQPPKFWEREPFVWDDEGGRVSRFVSLGAFGGESVGGKKQRWFYAFSMVPDAQAAVPTPRPSNATKNPYTEAAPRSLKRPLETGEAENFIFGNVHQPVKRNRVVSADQGKPPPNYRCRRCDSAEHFISDCPERTEPPEGYVCRFCNIPGHLVRDCPTKYAVGDTGGRKPREGYVCRACGSDAHYIDDCPVANQRQSGGDRRTGKRGPPREIAPDECWFCLSNPNLAKHLIVAIGEESYLTLPKGQIIPTQSSADHVNVPGGGHVLIVPIIHCPTLLSAPSDLSSQILEETEKYKNALRAMFTKYSSAAVFFEVGRLSAKGGHAHIQAVPVPLKLRNEVEQAFVKEGRSVGVDFETDPEAALQACADENLSYFRVDLPDGRKMVHLMKDHVPFSVQFGRQVLVSLLNTPDRIDWKACMLTEDEDRADAQAFKAAFSPFDPTR